ncbi:MAG: helix-turn-helix domain-containing protein [Patescibacteria group bacterium]|nr:helix-turn-helix domain-containing protein [Patescibacteria group bacterium]
MSDDGALAPILQEIVDGARDKSVAVQRSGRRLRADPAAIARAKSTDDKEAMKVKVIGYLRQGMTVKEAASLIGRTPKTIYDWTYKSTRYRMQFEAAMEAAQRAAQKANMTVLAERELLEPIVREDFATWTQYVVAFRKAYFGFDTFDHQWAILQAWENAPAGGISMVLLPPRAGKTTLLLDALIADLCANPNMRISLISEAQDFARKMMGRVQRRLDSDGGMPSPLLQHFGPFKPEGSRSKKWNSDEFTLLASDHDEQDPSCVSVGIGSNIRGARWDRVYLDDVQSLRTQANTQKYVELFRGDIITRPGKRGRIIITGSRVARGDFYEELERLELIDELVVIPALDLTKPPGQQTYFPLQWKDKDGNATDDPDQGVEPILEEDGTQVGWSDQDLASRRKQVGEDQWSRVYMMQPQSDLAAMLSAEDIANATDQDRLVGTPVGVGTINSLDPSLHAHAAFTVCGYDAERLYVMDVVDLHKPTTNQNLYGAIERLTSRYRPEYWVIENNTLQSGYLTDDAFLDIKARYGFQAVGHHTGDSKRDEKLGVPAMMDAIVRGEIRFPKMGENDLGLARLFDQLISWRPDIPTRRLVQDEVMSLWFAYLLWKKLRTRVDPDLSGWQREGLASVTLYPWATSNLAMPGHEAKPKTPITYEQQWDMLRGKVPA